MNKVIKSLFWTIADFFFLPIHYLPGPIASRLLRPWLWRFRLKKLGTGCLIGPGVYFVNPEHISIDDYTWIDTGVVLLAGKSTQQRKTYYRQNESFPSTEGDLHIGKNCHLAPYVVISAHGGVWIGDNLTIAAGSKIYSLSHHYRNPLDPADYFPYKFTSMAPMEEQMMISGPVVIADNAAIGLNVVVLPGITIGQYSWVGVQSVVQTDIPPCVIASGIPCEIIKQRKIEN